MQVLIAKFNSRSVQSFVAAIHIVITETQWLITRDYVSLCFSYDMIIKVIEALS